MQEEACLPQSQLPILFPASLSCHPIAVLNPRTARLPVGQPTFASAKPCKTQTSIPYC